jgi:ATP/maltotriose-dependent transcriptional regulator MalT
MQLSVADPIDTHRDQFLSYAPPMRSRRQGMEESWVAVEPEIGEYVAAEPEPFKAVFPLRYSKVQKPLLPPDTLSRERLLSWMDAHIDRKVIYLVAEAGFGKTTLIADYARRSRRRTFWYRLDEDDTDGLAFLRYLVAACQAVDPGLLQRTSALLNETTIEPLRADVVTEALLTEVEPLGDAPSMLVLDDFHMVESIPSITPREAWRSR